MSILWPHILNKSIQIHFAHQSFIWSNSAKAKAAVFCVIVGLSCEQERKKTLFSKHHQLVVDNISPYLLNASDTIVSSRTNPLSQVPKMVRGSSPVDGGNLILNENDKANLISSNPEAVQFIKALVGADDYLNGKKRWCLWITNNTVDKARLIPYIENRIKLVEQFRLSSKKAATRDAAKYSYRFFEPKHQPGDSIIVPRVTSERREYLQCGFLSDTSIVLDRSQVIYNPNPVIIGILSSKIHHVWTSVVSGRLKMDINYSVSLSYNNFPFPTISEQRKQEITQCVFRILDEREKHPEKTLAQLYDPDKMPEGLHEAHRLNDLAVERCYRSKPFESDEERLEYLFKLYEKMMAEEKEN